MAKIAVKNMKFIKSTSSDEFYRIKERLSVNARNVHKDLAA